MSIYEKLMNIQGALKAPKNQYNSFGKYNYRSCEDILEGVKPLLLENKVTLTISDESLMIGDRFYIKAIVKLTDIKEGQSIEVSALAREDENKKGMDLAQVTGSTSSYARKYALNGLFCIDDTKDSDATNKHGKDKDSNNKNRTQNKPKQEKKSKETNATTDSKIISKAQAKRLFAISNGNVDLIKKIILKYNYTSSKEIQTKDYNNICKEVQEEVQEAVKQLSDDLEDTPF